MQNQRRLPGPAANRQVILICVIALIAASCAPAKTPPTGDPSVAAPTAGAVVIVPGPSLTPLSPANPNTSQPTTSLALPNVSGPAASPTPQPQAENALPDPNTAQWKAVTPDLGGPVGIANAGDGSGRLFVLVRSGVIRVIRGGQLLDAPFLDITHKVGSRGSEQGLLGIAFHPKYSQTGFFYVNYTDLNGDTVIARFHADPGADQADPASEQVLIQVRQPFPNHNGGGMAFGPDGYLYLGLGDGGSQGDPQNNGQSTQVLLGKLLRIDVDHGSPYAIPPDNPPWAKGGGLPEVWAYGLRNPWRFSFDATTHDLYIADVGQDTYEEIDFLPAGSPGGANFGWRYKEGMHQYGDPVPAGVNVIDPVYEYTHQEGGCSVTGGYVYRGKALPAWQGVYIFADYCTGYVWGLARGADGAWTGQILFQTGLAITSFGVDEQGELYLADQRSGLYELVPR